MKALSLDLRQRILQAYLRGEGSQRRLAQRFSVSRASVERLVKLHRETGSVQAKPHAGGRASIVEGAHRPSLKTWLRDNPDLTQQALAERFTETTGRSLSQQTMSRALRRLAITRKKRP